MTGTVIQLKKSATPSAQPGSLANGELAINYADGKLFYKDSLGSIQQISSGSNSYSTINVAGSLIVADMGSDILTINKGENIDISTDILNDTFTISANLKPAFDMANLAWELANTANAGGGSASVSTSDSAPVSPIDGDLWWNSLVGKLFVYYDDGSSSQWVEASGGLLYSAETIATAAYNAANAAFDRANTSNDVLFVVSAYDTANQAFDKANSANLLAYNIGIGANAYSDLVGLSANNYAGAMANSANAYSATVGISTNNYTSVTYSTLTQFGSVFGVANGAFGRANNSLANTTNTVFTGNISITKTATLGSAVIGGSFVETKVTMAGNDVNLSLGSYFTKTISGATTLTVSNVPTTGNVGSFVLDLTNGGSALVTWWSGVKWASGAAPTLTTSGRDLLGFFTHDGGTTWNGILLGKGMA